MNAIFLVLAAFFLVPASYLYWRFLSMLGRNRAGAKLAFAFSLLSGLVCLNVAAYSIWKQIESEQPQHLADLIIRDDLETSATLYYGLIATGVALFFPRTNPHRHRFAVRCRACGNRRALHSPLCIRCGARILPAAEGVVDA